MGAKLELESPSKDFGEQLWTTEMAACSSNMLMSDNLGNLLGFSDLLGHNCLN